MPLDRIARVTWGEKLSGMAGRLWFLAEKVGDAEVEPDIVILGRLADLGNEVQNATRRIAEDMRR